MIEAKIYIDYIYDKEKDEFVGVETDYIVYPTEGKIINKITEREVGKGKKRVVLEVGKKCRKNVKKIKAVYETAKGPINPGDIIIALNGDETDARLENIKVMCRKEYFENHDWSKLVTLTLDQVEEIKAEYKEHEYTNEQLALKYKCSKSTIQKVLVGEYFYDKKKAN